MVGMVYTTYKNGDDWGMVYGFVLTNNNGLYNHYKPSTMGWLQHYNYCFTIIKQTIIMGFIQLNYSGYGLYIMVKQYNYSAITIPFRLMVYTTHKNGEFGNGL